MNDVHEIKIESKYFHEILEGTKKFEIRKNDRDYQIGDGIVLYEVIDGKITNHTILGNTIKYILHGPLYGLEKGYCIFNW